MNPIAQNTHRLLAFALLTASILLCATQSWASTMSLDDALQRASELKLSNHAQWRNMLYYPKTKSKKTRSAVALPEFFISPEGRNHPETELTAEITQLLTELKPTPDSSSSVNIDGRTQRLSNTSLSCRFPARREWLIEQLNLQHTLDERQCPELNEWLSDINPHNITIIYASNNMDGPSSMFGHSLIRIDQMQNKKNPMLNYAISYAAETDPNDNPVWYAARGLVGLYPGSFALMPYYEKVKQYGDLEGRDLWEYELNLTPTESRRLAQHFWELKGVRFPYYYFHSNCAYELLHLLEIARPGVQLQRHFPVYAIPAETVRTALDKGKLLKQTHFRPAFSSRLAQQAYSEPAQLTERAKQLASNPDANLSDLDERAQASVLEMAYDYLYYQHLAHKIDNVPQSQQRLRQLLLRRSQLAIEDQRPAVTRPEIDPANSHHDKRLTVMTGRTSGKNFTDIDLRPAYHDSLDPLGGYRASASIDFLRATLRVQSDKTQLQQFTLLNIDSLASRNVFFKPTTMNVKIAWERTPTLNSAREIEQSTQWHLQGGTGVAYGKEDKALCFAQAQGALELSGRFSHNARLGAGPRVGCNWYPRGAGQKGIQVVGKAQSLYWSNAKAWESEFNLGVQYQISQNFGIRMDGTANYLNNTWIKQWRVGIASYF